VKTGQSYSQQIKSEALRLGFSDCGISAADFLPLEAKRLTSWLDNGCHAGLSYMENHFDLRTDPRLLVESAKSVVSVILNYYPPQKQTDPEAPVIAKYAYGKDYHRVMRKKLKSLLTFTSELIPDCRGRVFTDSAPVMEHAWASRAGLGWIGKNSLLLSSRFGSFVFIGEMIITAELRYDEPINDMCGSCRNCIISCPTGAIIADRVVDAGRCISYHTIENKTPEMPEQFKDKFHNRVFGCDICQDVCPWNRKITPHEVKEFNPHPDLPGMTKNDWHTIDEDKFNRLFRGSAVMRAKFEGLKRNLGFLRESVSQRHQPFLFKGTHF
jgi:epoxyqueuosine reductase